jgi:hypothetical protein
MGAVSSSESARTAEPSDGAAITQDSPPGLLTLLLSTFEMEAAIVSPDEEDPNDAFNASVVEFHVARGERRVMDMLKWLAVMQECSAEADSSQEVCSMSVCFTSVSGIATLWVIPRPIVSIWILCHSQLSIVYL